MLNQIYIDNIINTALFEDINYIDVTTDNLIDDSHQSSAYFIAKDSGVLCGIDIAARVFELAGGNVETEILLKDGTQVKKGDVIANLKGSTKTLLKGERTALNLLQHMSGIATAANKCVRLAEGTNAKITYTRKTLPGLRAMLKDNHIDAYGSITAAVRALREKAGHMLKIEVEVRTFEELKEALDCGCEIIMLDNMSTEDMKKAVEITAGRAKLEASGNITLDNLRETALTGVDIISLGALTHSVKCFDISMRIKTAE